MHDIPISSISMVQIQYFIKTVELNSFTQAASHLHVTQSAISKTIAGLESTLGLQMFVRNKQSLQLTPAGRHLYEKWSEIVKQLEQSIEQAHDVQRGYTRSLRIGGLDSHRPDSLISPIVRAFQKTYPGINIRLETGAAPELKMMLINRELDCIFTVLYDVVEDDANAYYFEQLLRCPLEVCMLQTNPLAQKEKLTVGDLRTAGFISISPVQLPSYSNMLKRLCKPHRFTPNVSCYAPNANALPLNLITDDNIFICDQFFRDYNADHLCFKPLENTQSGIALCWSKEEQRPQVLNFIEQALLFRQNHSIQE